MFSPSSGFSLHAEWLAAAPEGPPVLKWGPGRPTQLEQINPPTRLAPPAARTAVHVDARGPAERLPGAQEPGSGWVGARPALGESRTVCRVGASRATAGQTWVLQRPLSPARGPLCPPVLMLSHWLTGEPFPKAAGAGRASTGCGSSRVGALGGCACAGGALETKRRPRTCDEGPWAGCRPLGCSGPRRHVLLFFFKRFAFIISAITMVPGMHQKVFFQSETLKEKHQ